MKACVVGVQMNIESPQSWPVPVIIALASYILSGSIFHGLCNPTPCKLREFLFLISVGHGLRVSNHYPSKFIYLCINVLCRATWHWRPIGKRGGCSGLTVNALGKCRPTLSYIPASTRISSPTLALNFFSSALTPEAGCLRGNGRHKGLIG